MGIEESMTRRELRSDAAGFAADGAAAQAMPGGQRGGGARRSGIGGGSMTSQVALFALVVALLGAVFAYLGNAALSDAGLFRSEAAQKRSEAAAQLSDFQAHRTDRALNELARDLAPQERKAAFQARADALKEEQNVLRAKAEQLEAAAAAWEKRSNEQLQLQRRWTEAVVALQVAIVLAGLALMTRKRWLQYGMLFMGLIGLSFGAVALLYGQ